MNNIESLNIELKNKGLIQTRNMDPLEVLVNTNVSSKPYQTILIEFIDLLSGNELEMVIRALPEKGIKGVSKKLIDILNNSNNYPNLDLWTVGNALNIIDDKSVYNDILKICRNKDIGMARQMLMSTLRKINTEESFNILIESLQDESIRGHAIEELGKWGDIRAIEPIQNTEVKKGLYEARIKNKTIKKLKQAINNS
ncbi:HEAT repeat domain-containing protein [Mangrovivirga cuniculi]|uniref:HEAT repeat domain-containing protein n=1 Tax=Mangrovivirga cuniculi TaxID=2715131 RepID=A0A4D7JJ12_9BACT|nr:HEAT repeat domain-containing protein [Mangrovivirga cuniculi]QCK15571.1 hypothetical protein DCC35_12850 [Mangrovivirga cuniculi]